MVSPTTVVICRRCTSDTRLCGCRIKISMFLQRLQPSIAAERIIDSLVLARRKHPAGPNSLDALCARYQIDTSQRTLHGALLDSFLLAEVYVELIGGRQASLILADERGGGTRESYGAAAVAALPRPEPRLFRVTEAEMAAHRERLDILGDKAIWLSYLAASGA